MKKVFILLLIILLSCETAKPLKGLKKTESEALGGFSSIDLNAPIVKNAVRYLIDQKQNQYPHVVSFKVIKAYSQVVAGTNIKLIIAYQFDDNPKELYCMTIIAFDLQRKPVKIKEFNVNYDYPI